MGRQLHSKYKWDGLFAQRSWLLTPSFEAGNFETAYGWHDHFVTMPVDDTTGDPTEYTMTVVEVGAGNSTAALSTAAVGGVLLLTGAGNEDDGVNLQHKGEAWKLASGKNLWFEAKFRVSEATQMDFCIGLCITDTDLCGGLSDGAFFRKADGATTMQFVAEKNSTESAQTALATTVAATWYEVGFYFNGTKIRPFIDGTELTSVTTNIPDDEQLTFSVSMLNGSAAARTMEVDWVRIAQLV